MFNKSPSYKFESGGAFLTSGHVHSLEGRAWFAYRDQHYCYSIHGDPLILDSE